MQYCIVIERGEKNFGAYSPDIAGCGTIGYTIEETLTNMQECIEFHFEGMLENNETIPEPKGLLWHLQVGELELAPSDILAFLTVNIEQMVSSV